MVWCVVCGWWWVVDVGGSSGQLAVVAMILDLAHIFKSTFKPKLLSFVPAQVAGGVRVAGLEVLGVVGPPRW